MKKVYLFVFIICLFSCSLEIPSDLPYLDKELSIEAVELESEASQIKILVNGVESIFSLQQDDVYLFYSPLVIQSTRYDSYYEKKALFFHVSLPDNNLFLDFDSHNSFLIFSFERDSSAYSSISFQSPRIGLAEDGEVLKVVIKGVLYNFNYLDHSHDSQQNSFTYPENFLRPDQESWYQNGLPPDSATPFPFEIQIIAKEYIYKNVWKIALPN